MKEQLSKGTVTVTKGSPLVQGDDLVDWTQVDLKSLCLFIHDSKPYDIALVDPVLRRLTLVAPFAGNTASAQPYVIVRDFTSNFDLPRLNPGDLEAAVLFSRLADTMDNLLSKGGGQPSTGEILIAKNAHGFLVGNALTLKTGTWGLANSSSAADAVVVGFVKAVPDANSFTLITQGYVSGVVGMTLVAGTVYSLSNSPTNVTGGKTNITDNPAFIGLNVPVLMADGPTGGYILSLAAGSGGQFSIGVPGIVTGPTQQAFDNNWVLSAKNQWILQTVSNQSMLSQHLNPTGTMTPDIDWPAFGAGVAGYSILKHLVDLDNRLKNVEAYGGVMQTTTLRRSKVYAGTYPLESKTFVVPGRVGSLSLSVYSGSAYYEHAGNSLYYGAVAVELLLKCQPGDIIRADFGYCWTMNVSLVQNTRLGIYPKDQIGQTHLYKNDILVAKVYLSSNRIIDLFGPDVSQVRTLPKNTETYWAAYNMSSNVFSDNPGNIYYPKEYIRLDDGNRLSEGVGSAAYAPIYVAGKPWDIYRADFAGFVQILYTN